MSKKNFRRAVMFLLGIHGMGLAAASLFRLIQFVALHGMVTETGTAVWPAFLRGVWFDNVVACYLMVLPIVVVLLPAALGYCRRWLLRAAAAWLSVTWAIALMPSAANIPYFAYFFKNINASIFEWFGYAGTTAGMVVQERSYWLYILLYFVITGLLLWGIVRWTKHYCRQLVKATARPLEAVGMVVVSLLLTGLCFFGIRGRTGYNPIKVSQAYYCNDPFLNQLGINPAFNLLTSTLDNMRRENAELHLTDYRKAISYTRKALHIEGAVDSTHVLRREVKNAAPLLTVEQGRKPNVVVILMESMSSALLHRGLTPTLDSLEQRGLYFPNFYSAGIHTNHGMTATLYSFPALMERNLMKGTVTPRRDGLPTVLKSQGYHNIFFMTHEAQYDNMNAFFRTNGYDEVYAQEDYPGSEVVNSFGVSDHFLFNYALERLSDRHANAAAGSGKPFMATILTISNHPPYVIPSWFKPHTSDPETQIVEYADLCIGDFLRRAAKEPWSANTVFVVQADHGKMVGDTDTELPQSYNHIPLYIFGAGIEPQRCDGLGMQVDVMPTLLALLGMDYTYDGFGVNLLGEQRDMVFYSADNQVVARDSSRCYIYEPQEGRSLCYNVQSDGRLQKCADGTPFHRLRDYVFSMIQTAEYIYRK